MTTARRKLVDESVTPWYHCISRCVRRSMLMGKGFEHRKEWIEERLQLLVQAMAVQCAGFSIMDNHLHLLLRLDSARAATWSDEDVVRRWARLFPPRRKGQGRTTWTRGSPRRRRTRSGWPRTRQRLASLSWFMKCLKEPLARLANKEDGCTGAFWEGRFRSVAILDEESLLATCAYIDLNPVAAGISPTPEESPHTSFHARVEHCRSEGSWSVARRVVDCHQPGGAGAEALAVADRGSTGAGLGSGRVDARFDAVLLRPACGLDEPPGASGQGAGEHGIGFDLRAVTN